MISLLLILLTKYDSFPMVTIDMQHTPAHIHLLACMYTEQYKVGSGTFGYGMMGSDMMGSGADYDYMCVMTTLATFTVIY